MKLRRPIEAWASRPWDAARHSLHKDIFAAAIILCEEGQTQEDIFTVMREAANSVSEREVPDRELISAIECAVQYVAGALHGRAIAWPLPVNEFMGEVINSNTETARAIVDAARSTPNRRPAEMVAEIYRPDDLVCLGFSARDFGTGTISQVTEWLGLGLCEYINPNPMSKTEGITKEGKPSAHCDDNTGPKVFQVVEFDRGDPLWHVAVLIHLARTLPLMMMVYSGGKSVHGWFLLSPEDDVAAFFYEACTLGADPKLFSKCQFTRLPYGMNAKHGRVQKVLYFDPRYTRKASV